MALPIRRFGAFLPGEGVGGSGIHWGASALAQPADRLPHPQALTQRYGAKAIPDDMTITDWPLSYDELEPYYDRFDKLCGVSGQAGNLRGQIVAGGNPFEGPRSDHYPNKPIKSAHAGMMFGEAAKSLGYHPFPAPVAIASARLRQQRGHRARRLRILRLLQPHGLRGQRQGVRQHHGAAGAARGSEVRAAHARLRDASSSTTSRPRRSPASSTPTCAPARNTSSRPASWCCRRSCSATPSSSCSPASASPTIPPPARVVVGKNYCYQFEAGAEAFFEDKEMNPFIGNAGMGVCIDDFNGENFDHSGLGFFGGGYFICGQAGAPPIGGRAVPHGTPSWGSEWKRATVKWYHHFARFNTQGSVYANRENFMDLDPTYKDALGRPLLRLTYNGTDNDHTMSRYLLVKLEEIVKAMNPTHYEMHPRPKNFTIVPYQSTHNTGGTMMGTDPKSSVVNRYLQAWDAPQPVHQGASVFPQQHGYNPTGTVGALAYWSANAITSQYLKNPGPLVHA